MLTGLSVAIVAVVLAGVTYEQVGRRQDRKRYRQTGLSVDIGGRTLNIYCLGEGSPTVVFDSGGHTAGYDWIAIQPQVAKFTRACWYDRAGFGWSDPGQRPRTFQAVMNDLHTLLQAGAIPPPYVLVGTNLSGMHVRVYTGLYPASEQWAAPLSCPRCFDSACTGSCGNSAACGVSGQQI
jgi:pimeloyl-ACP methyl ester carboxylesterase